MNPLLYKNSREFSKANLLELEQWQSLEKVNNSCAVDANGVSSRKCRVRPPASLRWGSARNPSARHPRIVF